MRKSEPHPEILCISVLNKISILTLFSNAKFLFKTKVPNPYCQPNLSMVYHQVREKKLPLTMAKIQTQLTAGIELHSQFAQALYTVNEETDNTVRQFRC